MYKDKIRVHTNYMNNVIIIDTKSEWLLLSANSSIVQLFHSESELSFNDMMMRSGLYLTNTLNWIFIVLAL